MEVVFQFSTSYCGESQERPLILWSLIYVLLRTIMIIVPPLGLEDAFLESYSVVRNAEVRAMYHVKSSAVDRLDIANTSLYVRVHIHLHIHLVVSYYCDKVIRLGACIDHW